MTQRYHVVDIRFTCDETGPNRALLTVYGESEFAILAELRKQYPNYTNVSLLDVTIVS